MGGKEKYTLTVSEGQSEPSVSSQIPHNRRTKRVILIVVVTLLVVAVITVVAVIAAKKGSSTSKLTKDVVILISLDGFRHDYLKRGFSPNIRKLARNGVVADFMRPQFPSKTFPNHYSIVTGLYPESHGIVANSFLDKKLNDLFRIGGKTSNDGKWWQGEPIWVSAEKQGLKAASYFWVGSEAPIEGIRPSYWKKYNKKVPYQDRVKQVLEWLSYKDKDRPSFITLYHYQPDSAGHSFGPDSSQVNQGIRLVDDMIGLLYKGLEDMGIENNVNIIIVSDHGMTSVDCKRVIYLDQMVNMENATLVGQGTLGFVYTKTEDDASTIFKGLQCGHEKLRVYSKSGIYSPKRMHFSHNRRAGDITIVPEVGWSFLARNGSCRPYLRGAHGYDNVAADMRTFFVSHGPAFKKGYNAGYFDNIQLYNLICGLLGIKPAPNNGTAGSLVHLLNDATRKRISIPVQTGDGDEFKDTCMDGTATNATCMSGSCICPYCSYLVLNNITKFQDHLFLSADLKRLSHSTHMPWGLPKGGAGSKTSGCILTQRHYIIGYSKALHLPLWVGYKLTQQQLDVNIPRKNCFRQDPRLRPEDSASCSDYAGSSYDRGHMAPNGDFNFDRYAEQDTNVFSNIAPQHKSFNRNPGLWYKTEQLIREWTTLHGPLYVIVGSIFDHDNDGLRDPDNAEKRWLHGNKFTVAIPSHYYKIVLRCLHNDTGEYKIPSCKGKLDVFTVILPHQEEPLCKLQTWQAHLVKYIATIRDVEQLTGSHFFPDLPVVLQAELKSKLPLGLWPNSAL